MSPPRPRPGIRSGPFCRALSLALLLLVLVHVAPQAIPAATEQEGIAELRAGDKANDRSDYPGALAHYEAALKMFREADAEMRVGEATLGMAFVYYNLGQAERSEKLAREARKIGEKYAERLWTIEANADSLLGDIAFDRGDYPVAIDCFERAKAIADERGGKQFAAHIESDLANVYWSFGDYRKAIESSERSLKLGEERRNKDLQLNALITLGNVHLDLNDHRRARSYLERALDMATTAGEDYTKSVVYDALAFLHSALGDAEKAMSLWRSSLMSAERVGSRKLVGGICESLGNEYLRLGDLSTAETYLTRAESLCRETGDEWNLGWVHQDLTRLRASQGRYAEAREAGLEAVKLARGRNDLEQIWSSLYVLALAARSSGDTRSAITWSMDAISSIETARPGIQQTSLRSVYMADKQALYELATDLLLTEGRLADAFQVVEKYRARVFYEMLFRPSLVSPIDWKRDPGLNDIFFPRFAGIVELQQQLLQEGDVFIEYMVGEKAVYGFGVTRAGFAAKKLCDSTDLSRRISRYLEFFGRGTGQFGGKPGGRTLHRLLVAPILDALGESPRRLIIAPDADLHLLPFETLVTPTGRHLIEDSVVTYISSATILRTMLDRPIPGGRARLLAVANPGRGADPEEGPELPFSRREVEAAARYFDDDATLLTGRYATKRNFFSQDLSRPTVFHFATHAIIDEADSIRSHIVMYSEREGEDLYFADILGKRWSSPLAVLSACSSGRGRIMRGEGLDGFARSFIYSGVNGVVLTLWAVEDEASFRLMSDFYAQLAAGHPIDVSLREAKMAHLQEHPSRWAGFVCMGRTGEAVFVTPARRHRHLTLWAAAILILGTVAAIAWVLSRSRSKAGD